MYKLSLLRINTDKLIKIPIIKDIVKQTEQNFLYQLYLNRLLKLKTGILHFLNKYFYLQNAFLQLFYTTLIIVGITYFNIKRFNSA